MAMTVIVNSILFSVIFKFVQKVLLLPILMECFKYPKFLRLETISHVQSVLFLLPGL
jgi:hypothetical protein